MTGGITWKIENETLYVRGKGRMEFPYENGMYRVPWYYEDFRHAEIDDGITSIGPESFHTSDLEEICLPDSVTEIGPLAFCECRSLRKAELGRNVKAVSAYAFMGCDRLERAVTGDALETVGPSAFENCWELEGTVTSPVLREIGGRAYAGCVHLRKAEVPASAVSVEDNPFAGCARLEEISVSSGNPVFTSRNGALFAKGGAVLKAVPGSADGFRMGDEVVAVAKEAFRGCVRLERIEVPPNVSAVDDGAFRDCVRLGEASFLDTDKDIRFRLNAEIFRDCRDLVEVRLRNGTRSIGESAFRGCSSLTGINLPDSVEEVGYSAFRGCSSLTGITMPDGLVSIGKEAFYGCGSLKDVSMGFCLGDEDSYIPPGTRISYRE